MLRTGEPLAAKPQSRYTSTLLVIFLVYDQAFQLSREGGCILSLWLLSTVLSGVYLLGIWSAIHAAVKVKSSQGAIAWAMGLLLLPYVTLPLYWVFGRNRFRGYVEVLRQITEQADHHHPMQSLKSFRATLPAELAQHFGLLAKLHDTLYTRGNHLELLINGRQTFDTVFEIIGQAQQYVLIQFFIIRDDELGRKFHAALLAKAAQGVKVYLLYDEIGCHALNRYYLQRLRAGGVAVRSFNTTRGWRNRFQLNFRNHRKMVIADGHIALTGGLNVGDEYLGLGKLGYWRDTFLKLEGPSVQALQCSFQSDWYWASRKLITLNVKPRAVGDQTVLIHATGPTDKFDACSMMFHQAIIGARRRLWITSPYFVPSHAVFEVLQLAALRGVDVRILLPEKPDHKLVYLASFTFLKAAERAGIKLYRYQRGFLHQKVILVDDDVASVGTANLDNRSLYLNFEVTALVVDKCFAAQVSEMLEEDFTHSRKVSSADLYSRGWLFRWAVRLARLFDPVL